MSLNVNVSIQYSNQKFNNLFSIILKTTKQLKKESTCTQQDGGGTTKKQKPENVVPPLQINRPTYIQTNKQID